MLPNSSALRSYRSDKEPAYRCAVALGRQACPLRHACGVPPLPKGEALACRIVSCIFLPKFMLYLFCGSSRPSYLGREVYLMIHILTILESVVADVMSHYICKWLDRFDKDRKPD